MTIGYLRLAGLGLVTALGCTPPPEPSRAAPLAVAAEAGAPSVSPGTPASPASPAERICQKDADCTFVALGCCSTTAVSRVHADTVRARLRGSHLPHCPPKAACGPGPDGTWDGAEGRCSEGLCRGGPDTP